MEKDVDDIILDVLNEKAAHRRSSELKHICMSHGISRATYFRHIQKLEKNMQIEKFTIFNEKEEKERFIRAINSGELARSEDIKFYLTEIDSSDRTIQNRGLKFLQILCSDKRAAWFFLQDDGLAAFKKRLTKSDYNVRLVLLRVVEYMITREPKWSSGRIALIESIKKTIEDIARTEKFADIRAQALRIAELCTDGISSTNLALEILEKVSDGDFEILLSQLQNTLTRSEEAKKRKILIRERLDAISIRDDELKVKVSRVLDGAPA